MDIFDHWPAPLEPAGKRFHVTFRLDRLLGMSDGELSNLITDGGTGKTMTPDQVREVAKKHLADGRTYFPPCCNPDKRGLCDGHPIYKLAEGWAA
jgi:hypothetical protein